MSKELLIDKKNNKMMNNILSDMVSIYCIKYKNIPIYIGSTNNIYSREISHNKQLINSIKNNYHSIYLYDFLKDKMNGSDGKIKEIKLIEIKKVYNDIVIISDNIFEYRRNIEEEKIIRHCMNKGIGLLNMKYPCRYWIDENNKIIKRDDIQMKIDINDYRITINENILEFINTKSIKEIYSLNDDKDVDDILFNNLS